MRKTSKKIFSLVAAATLVTTAFIGACGKNEYKGDAIEDYKTEGVVSSNGGFAVEKGEFVYFINGSETYTADNVYGEAVKGALMRVAKADLANKDYSKVKTVVPQLLVSQNYDSGIYIFGDYVYYATPTTDKNLSGDVENSWIDFKRAKLDGSEGPEDYFLRLENNAAKFRFVQAGADNDIYCLYEEDGALKSYNVTDDETHVLVSGAKSAFFFDKNDPTNANVYYTMAVTYDVDKANSATAAFDQVYCVNAAATAEVDEDEASYTVAGGKTYDFDKKFMEEKNKEAKENDEDEPYDFKDYATYPYVNLGNLVLDGIGQGSREYPPYTSNKTDALTPDGYTYTISSYENGGLYFTRKANVTTESAEAGAKLYYLADKTVSSAQSWNPVIGNKAENLTTVAYNTTNASSSAIFLVDGEGKHSYLYVADGTLYKAFSAEGALAEINAIPMAYNLSEVTLWQVKGNYLYYYASGTNGNNLSRINYTGDKAKYNPLLVANDYKPATLAIVDWNSSWYKPEIVSVSETAEVLLFSNAQSFGSGATAYNYIYAADLNGIAENADLYKKISEEMEEQNSEKKLYNAMQYYFRTGDRTLVDDLVEDEEILTDEQMEIFEAFVAKFAAEGEYKKENAFINRVSKMTEADAEAIENAWKDYLYTETASADKDGGLPTWAIVLIVVGSVIVVAAAVLVPLLILHAKKKAKAEEDDAIVNAAKRPKIDTTDDKSIDVYAEEEPVTEETAETAAEESVEQPAEEPVEEVEATPVAEETVAEEPAQTEVADEEK